MNPSLYSPAKFLLRAICLLAFSLPICTVVAQPANVDRIIEAGGLQPRMIQAGAIPIGFPVERGNDAKFQLEATAKLEIESLVAICNLDAKHAEKLQLAANADIARYMHETAELQQIIALRTQPRAVNEQEMKTMQTLMQRTQRRDVFGHGSLLDKTISTTLSTSQKVIRQEVQAKKLARAHHARVLQTVAGIERTMLFRKDQRNWLIERLDRQELDGYPPNLEPFVGQLKLLKIPRAEMATKFDAAELEAIFQPLERFQEVFVR